MKYKRVEVEVCILAALEHKQEWMTLEELRDAACEDMPIWRFGAIVDGMLRQKVISSRCTFEQGKKREQIGSIDESTIAEYQEGLGMIFKIYQDATPEGREAVRKIIAQKMPFSVMPDSMHTAMLTAIENRDLKFYTRVMREFMDYIESQIADAGGTEDEIDEIKRKAELEEQIKKILNDGK